MKMDRHLVSNEPWELDKITKRFGCTRDDIRKAKKQVGVGRRAIYKFLRNDRNRVQTLGINSISDMADNGTLNQFVNNKNTNMATTKKGFFGRLIAKIGAIFTPAFKGAKKAYDALPIEKQKAIVNGSGILDYVNQRLDVLPADVATGLADAFPDMDIAGIATTALAVAEAFNLIEDGSAYSLEGVIEKLQAYLKKQKAKGGKFWATASHGMAVLFAVLFGGTDTKVASVASLMEYVYHAFIKKDATN